MNVSVGRTGADEPQENRINKSSTCQRRCSDEKKYTYDTSTGRNK